MFSVLCCCFVERGRSSFALLQRSQRSRSVCNDFDRSRFLPPSASVSHTPSVHSCIPGRTPARLGPAADSVLLCYQSRTKPAPQGKKAELRHSPPPRALANRMVGSGSRELGEAEQPFLERYSYRSSQEVVSFMVYCPMLEKEV